MIEFSLRPQKLFLKRIHDMQSTPKTSKNVFENKMKRCGIQKEEQLKRTYQADTQRRFFGSFFTKTIEYALFHLIILTYPQEF